MLPIHVLIVSDDPILSRFVRLALGSDQRIEISGEVRDAFSARAEVQQACPDIMILDSQLPGMSGLTFLMKIMRSAPMPVMMVVGGDFAPLAEDALRLGAVDCLRKPETPICSRDFGDLADQLVGHVRRWGRQNGRLAKAGRKRAETVGFWADVPAPKLI